MHTHRHTHISSYRSPTYSPLLSVVSLPNPQLHLSSIQVSSISTPRPWQAQLTSPSLPPARSSSSRPAFSSTTSLWPPPIRRRNSSRYSSVPHLSLSCFILLHSSCRCYNPATEELICEVTAGRFLHYLHPLVTLAIPPSPE